MNREDVGRVYDTLLSMPGMDELVRLDFKIDRKSVLLLNQVICRGLSVKPEDGVYGLADAVSKDCIEVLKGLAGDCLEKAGLTALSGKLNALQGK